jgi:hypothetical protein
MREKRKTTRRFLLYYMRVYDLETHQQIGNLVDITPKGAMLVSEHPIPKGKTIQLRLELSEEVSEQPFLDFKARSKWCKPDVDPNLYNIGFEIKDISAEGTATIHKIIQSFGFRDNKL